MNIATLYYTGIPFLTCNMVLYTLNTISSSITSSKNLVTFFADHKICSKAHFRDELETLDLACHVQIMYAFIQTILEKHCQTDDERREICQFFCDWREDSADTQWTCISMRCKSQITDIPILSRVRKDIRIAIGFVYDTLFRIHSILESVCIAIASHEQSFSKHWKQFSLHHELSAIHALHLQLQSRFQLLVNIAKE